MEDSVSITEKFFLSPNTYQVEQMDREDFLTLILNESFWIVIREHSLNNSLSKCSFDSKSADERADYLMFGIACFTYFVQANFSGPDVPEALQKMLNEEKMCNTNFADLLTMNNEDINVNTKYPILLVTAKAIFENCIVNDVVNHWWLCRALMIHQEVLDELSPTLLSSMDHLFESLCASDIQGHMKAEFCIEMAQLYMKFRTITKVRRCVSMACEIVGLHFSLVGKLGRRTKFQTKDSPQLSLEITLTGQQDICHSEVDDSKIPQNFNLNDDVRLDHIEFSESIKSTKLSNTEQKLLLAIVQERLISSPSDELQIEEISPFIETILNQKNTYCVRIAALLLRCKIESKHKRTIERCLKQGEDIIRHFLKQAPTASHRIVDVFGTGLPPIWKVKAQYANLLLNFGLVKNALKMYINIQLWEEVIVCYTILQLHKKAEEVIKQQLAVKPTVKLLCLLGDTTKDVECYKKAWEMSKKRSHRAQRHWGQFLFNRKQYMECIPHLEKSLSINPLQAHIWLSLGFAALQVSNWQTAATAYRRYTSLEPEGFEAWNNLAQAYIHLGNKRSAHQAILEALKCNFDNWKIWENLLLVSYDILNYSDMIRAYHRLLDLQQKYLNLDALKLLVYSACNNTPDESSTIPNILQKTRELLGRVIALYPNNGAIWELYANLAPVLLLKAQRLQRAYRGYTQGAWNKDPKTCLLVLGVCKKLAEIALDVEIDPSNTILNSIKLNLSAALTTTKKSDWEETRELVEELTSYLNQIIEKLQCSNTTLDMSFK